MSKAIDKTDAEIIKYLQVDGRMPYTSIAKELALSEATVRSRVQRLLEEKVIQIVAVGDPKKLGFQVDGNIRLHVDPKKMDVVLEELKKIKEIWYIALATGGIDVNLEFYVRNFEDLQRLIYEKVNVIDGINKTETSIIISHEKRRYDWGTALD
jgi:Lrp/AsnC family transcriptional regulator for asnA, asnC and gidA